MIERAQLPIEALAVDAVQAREQAWTGGSDDQQLAASIETEGLLQDLIVRPIDAVDLDTGDDRTASIEYLIVAGSRRYHAAMQAGYETVPCKIVHEDDLEAAWTSLLENTDRQNLSEQEIASQLQLIYELVRPLAEPNACPQCGTAVDGEAGLTSHYGHADCSPPAVDTVEISLDNGEGGRFTTDRQARRYLAWRYLGRTDDSALSIIDGHLRTAQLPPILQSLFKDPGERSDQEQMALDNYGIDTRTTLGSGNGRSKASQVIASIHDTLTEEFDTDELDPTDAVLETVGRLRRSGLSEKDFERELRQFRRDLLATADTDGADTQRTHFREVLESHAAELREAEGDLEVSQPFRRVDVWSPESDRHRRWYAQVQARRDARSHGELIRELYQERLETLAEQRGWT